MADDTGSNRIFRLNDFADVTLRTLTITNGDGLFGANTEGGVIFSAVTSDLTVENSEVNAAGPAFATRGGVIASVGPANSLTSVITGGGVTSEGDGIYSSGAPVTIERSSIHTNTVSDPTAVSGGGLSLDNASLSMTDSEVVNNTITQHDRRGGRRRDQRRPPVAADDDDQALADKRQHGGGSGCERRRRGHLCRCPLNPVNSTIHNNAVNNGDRGGGGVYTATSASTLNNVTFAGNTNNNPANGDHLSNEGVGVTTYTGSIFSGGDNPCSSKTGGTLMSGGYNAITPADCPSTGTDNVGGAIGLAGALANNGGTIVGGTGGAPIRTLAITSASSAFLPSDANCAPGEGTDQRGTGFTRPQQGACDAGAFELQPVPVVTPPVTTGPTGQRAAALKKCKKKKTKKKRKKCKKKAKRLPI